MTLIYNSNQIIGQNNFPWLSLTRHYIFFQIPEFPWLSRLLVILIWFSLTFQSAYTLIVVVIWFITMILLSSLLLLHINLARKFSKIFVGSQGILNKMAMGINLTPHKYFVKIKLGCPKRRLSGKISKIEQKDVISQKRDNLSNNDFAKLFLRSCWTIWLIINIS